MLSAAQPLPRSTSPAQAPPQSPSDILGRTTPRGTVLGFLKAASKGDDELAAQYLNTSSKGTAAAAIAHQLFIVLDRRLPARLNQLSDEPEGSLPFLTRPDEDLVGTIMTERGPKDILVERITRTQTGAIWLFSRRTLSMIPALFTEINTLSPENVLPMFFVRVRFAQVPLFEWLAVLLGLPLLYVLASLLSRAVSSWVGRLRRRLRKNQNLPNPVFLPRPIRLLLVALIIRWSLSQISLSLLARQFWSATAAAITIFSSAWLLMLINERWEHRLRRRLERVNKAGGKTLLRLARRAIDVLIICICFFAALKYFGVNPTAALAGLGVGGIAVALAAQKTLENVIGGISITFDHVVRVGDMLNIGNTMGVVEYVGLRSTRIRTLDRTLVSVPNGQLANAQLENFSIRDKFWFHPNIGLRFETTSETMRSVLELITELLTHHPLVEPDSARASFLRLGASSLDIEVFAYFYAASWTHFLEIQQELLLKIMAIVEGAGAQMAYSSQTLYLASDRLQSSNLAPAVMNPNMGADGKTARVTETTQARSSGAA